jgi:hypothetical protein
MSRQRLFAVVVLGAGLSLAACGGSSSLCVRAANTYDLLAQKVGDCNLTPPAFNENLCEQEASACTQDDEVALNALFDCMNGIQACVPGGEDTYLNQLQACSDANAGVSNTTCSDAFTAQ